jgi:hypothetical protein
MPKKSDLQFSPSKNTTAAQECLQAGGEEGFPPFMDYTNAVGGYPIIRFQQQAL